MPLWLPYDGADISLLIKEKYQSVHAGRTSVNTPGLLLAAFVLAKD
jgi:hypothetical protein